MEQETDAVLKLKKNVSEILKDLIYFGQQIKEKSQNLLDQNETNSQLDINNIEYVTLGIASLMKKMKGNMLAFINNLRSNIRDVDDQYPDKLFDQVIDRLDLCERAKVILGPNNEYLFEQPCDKETMVDGLEKAEDDSAHDNNINSEVKQEVDESLCKNNKKKCFNLGLKKRGDTEDTDDSWPDSLCRSSLVDVSIRKSNAGSEHSESDLPTEVKDETHLEDRIEEDSRRDLCDSEVPPVSPASDSSSTIITDYKQNTESNLDILKNSFLNKLSTDTDNKSNIEPASNIVIDENKLTKSSSQITTGEEQSVFCISPNFLESVQVKVQNCILNVSTNSDVSIEETTSKNVTIEDSLIIPEENNLDIAKNKSDSQGIMVKNSVATDLPAAVIGCYEEATQQINSDNVGKIGIDSENQILESVADSISNENDVNGDQKKEDDYLNKSPWSVETEKLDSGEENTTDQIDNASNEKANKEETSMDLDNTRLSADSDETDIVNNSNTTNQAAPLHDESSHSDILSDVSLLEDSNDSFEFDIMDDTDYCSASVMTGIENREEPCPPVSATVIDTDKGDIDHNGASSKMFNSNEDELKIEEDTLELIDESKGHIPKSENSELTDTKEDELKIEEDTLELIDESKGHIPKSENSELTDTKESEIVTQDLHNNDSAGNCDLMHVTKVEAEDNKTQIIKEEDEMDSNSLRDDLLQLLREVPCTENGEKKMVSKSTVSTDSNSDCEKAQQILKLFEDESSDDFTDSETTTSDSNFIDSLSSDDNDDDNSSKIIPQEITNSPPNIENKIDILSYLKLKETRMDNCFVSLQRLQLNNDEIMKCKDILNASIDRLCDLNNLRSKRQSDTGYSPNRRRLKRRKKKMSNTELEPTDSDSDVQISEIRSDTPHLPEHLESKFDDILAKSLMDDLECSDQSKSSSDETDSSNSDLKNKKKNETGAAKSKREFSKEERKKKSWKYDSLLREKLRSDSDSSSSSKSSSSSQSSDSSKSSNSTVKNRKISRYERDSDFNISSDSVSSASNAEEKNKIVIKTNSSSTDISDDNSDIVIVENKDSPQKNSPQKGRRNIRALMSEESLAAETQQAHKEEEERINRLQDRLKLRETFTQSAKDSFEQSMSWSQCSDIDDPFVLDFEDVTGKPLIKVHPKLKKRLKPHQKDGVQFMWDSCYESVARLKQHSGSGCILAHCMGLGKTYQVLTLVHTLFSHEVTDTKRVLVVCPLSTVNSWKQEAKIAFHGLPEDKFCISTIADKKKMSQKYDVVKRWYLRKKGLLVLGYEGFSTITNISKLDKVDSKIKTYILKALVDPGPDLVICDEGHLLKNKTSLKTQALNKIRTKRRIMLTGTPLQNNLDEYYYMIQFVKPNLLGNIKEFKTNFVNPITNGQYEDSTIEDIKLMQKRTHVLFKLLKKTIQRVEDTVLKEYLPKMIDHALFIQLHNNQIELYDRYSQLCQERRNTKQKRSGFLADFRIFQYIGTHPHLLSVAEELKSKKFKERDVITEEEDNLDCDLEGWWKTLVPEDASNRIELGTKFVVFKALIEECEKIGDKMLVFSQSLPELELIEHFLKTIGTKKCASWQKKIDYCRMDGTVHPEVRTYICDKFNDRSNSRLRILLMSTKVGGLGLNLTAANRVIIMTVNWNPSYDTQSVFRAYRFGQEKPVYVYRLISLGTMEEKVYQRSITKLAIAHRVIDKYQITRHYQRTDLEELYSCKPTADEERPTPYVPEDKLLAKLISDLPMIFKYHEHRALLANNPADDLSEQEKIAAWDEFEKEKTAKAQPPPTSAYPSIPATAANGPTFNTAFNLSRNLFQVNPNKNVSETPKESDQYYTPKNLLPVTLSSKLIGSQNFIPMRLPPETTVTIEDVPSTSTITDKNVQSDPSLSIPIDLSAPLRKPKNKSHKKQNKFSNMELDKRIIEVLDKYAKNPNLNISFHNDEGNIQKQTVPPLSIANNTFNSPNLVCKSNVIGVNPMFRKKLVKIGKNNTRKRKLNNTYNTENSLKKLKRCVNETSRINSCQPIENQPTSIIVLDGDEEINSNKSTKYREQMLSKDIITLD